MKRRSLDGSRAWDVASGSDFKAEDMVPQLEKRGGRSSDKITSHDFLLICSVAGNSAHRFVASQGMQMVDQWRAALPGDWITGSGTR